METEMKCIVCHESFEDDSDVSTVTVEFEGIELEGVVCHDCMTGGHDPVIEYLKDVNYDNDSDF